MIDTDRMLRALETAFPEAGSAAPRLVRAPGRVNLIGEHTDYNEGFVLPVAISLETWIAARPSNDSRVEMVLDDGRRAAFDLGDIPPARGSWIDTVAGMAWSLTRADVRLHGMRAVVATEIPIGSGLSSSAALQIASAWAMADAVPPLPPMELSRAAQRAENAYVGVRSGIMDQFASTHGSAANALFLDCRSLEFRPVRLPMRDHAIVVCDTRVPRRLDESEYNARRAECESAVQTLARFAPEVRSLRDVGAEMLERHAGELEPVPFRRAMHVVTENARVLDSVAALEAGELDRLGSLWAESHRSLRERYEVTSPELDALVEIAAGSPGVVAARMTGAGFGGCTVNLVTRTGIDELRARVTQEYAARFGREPGVHVVEPVPGAGEVMLA